jgi:hypothetical protein
MTFQNVVEAEKLETARLAGQAAARYMILDPAYWLDQAGMAGVRFMLLKSGGFVTNCVEADFEIAVFLEAWMDASPGAMVAIDAMLRRRTNFRN